MGSEMCIRDRSSSASKSSGTTNDDRDHRQKSTPLLSKRRLRRTKNDDAGESKTNEGKRKAEKTSFLQGKNQLQKKTEKREGRSSKKAKFFTRKKGENDESIKKSSCQRMN